MSSGDCFVMGRLLSSLVECCAAVDLKGAPSVSPVSNCYPDRVVVADFGSEPLMDAECPPSVRNGTGIYLVVGSGVVCDPPQTRSFPRSPPESTTAVGAR